MTLASFFKSHWLATVGALLCGALFVVPQFVLQWNLGQEYRGMILGGIDGEFYYERIQDVYDGNLSLAGAGMAEYKHLPYTNSPLGELIVAGMGMIAGVSASGAVVIGDFIFPFLLFLVLYFFVFAVTKSKLFSLTVAAGIMFASNFIYVPRNVLDLFLNPEKIVVNSYNRPVHPQVSSLFFFSWLLMMWYMIGSERERVYRVCAGILLGALFYIYPYSWMLAIVIQGLLFVWFCTKKEWGRVRGLLYSGAIGLVVALPFYVNLLTVMRHPWYPTLQRFQGFYHTHEAVMSLLLIMDLLVIVGLYFKYSYDNKVVIPAETGIQKQTPKTNRSFSFLFFFLDPKSTFGMTGGGVSGVTNGRESGMKNILLFFFLFVVSLFVVLNQQVITGIRFFPGHWHWYYVVPFSVFLFLFGVWNVMGRWPRVRKWLFVLVICVFLVNGVVSQKNYYRDASSSAIVSQRLMPVYAWLNQNTETNNVVLADAPLSEWISFYTHNNHYLSTYFDTLSLIPEERVRHDFFVKKYLEGAREDNVDEFINQQTPEFHYVLFGYWRRYQFGCTECFPDEEIQKIKGEYLAFLQKDFHEELQKYQVDYLVFDVVNGTWKTDGMDFLKETARIGDFIIYQVN